MKRIFLRTERHASAGSSGERSRLAGRCLGLAMAVVLGAVVILGHVPAMAQNPTYTPIPRSNRGQSARIGNSPIGSSRAGTNRGSAPGATRTRPAQAAAPRAGAPRTANGSMNSNSPAVGGPTTRKPFSPNASGGVPILDPNQLKSGAAGQGNGVIRPRNR